MPKSLKILAVGILLVVQPAHAADYNCAQKETGAKLNDYDITVGKREAAIAEMQGEIKDGGGATEQQKKALRSFEEKLAKVKAERAALLTECPAKSEH